MNYGHALQFGTFITPSVQDPESVVALARHSEQLEFDLVTFQDHPYNPGLLDTMSLLTWVAAQTERIHVAGNVLNLPLRSPAMMAKAATTIDLLSHGRFALGLGAGGFLEATRAMGAPEMTAGDSITALEEAIRLMRQIWDTSTRGPVRFDGDHYHAQGMRRGPKPAHDIPIWLGAYKPRMLRLTGALADGWLPSLGYLQDGVKPGNKAIDEAALEAGRDPREIRRLLNISGSFSPQSAGLLNGPAEQWVEQLLQLAVEDGISTFILAADDSRLMDQFARDVMPALKQAYAKEVPESLNPAPFRGANALAKRHEGIDYDSIPASLTTATVEPGDRAYPDVQSTYMRGGAPGVVFQVKDTQQLADALSFAREHRELPFGVRSGGHGISGRSTNNGGIVIDLGALNQIEVLDDANRLVRIGPGARWGEVAAALEPHGWALSSGDYGGVGVGGLATAGGVGWLVRKHGLTIDHLKAAEIMLADGTQLRVDQEVHPDLFWAIRGAGANFGVVTSFEFQVDEVQNVGWAQLVFDASDIRQFLLNYGAALEAAPREVTSFLLMGRPQPGQPVYAQLMTMVDSDDPETIIELLQPLASIAPLVDHQIALTSYANVMQNWAGGAHQGYGEPQSRSGLVEHITLEFAEKVATMLRSGDVYFFQIRSLGGAVADVRSDATAFADRAANFSVVFLGARKDRMDVHRDVLAEHFSGTYLSFESDQRPERLCDAFPPAHLTRLRRLKEQYDPTNLFRDNFNIVPASEPVTT